MALRADQVSALKRSLAREIDQKKRDIFSGSVGGLTLAALGFFALAAVLYVVIGFTVVSLRFLNTLGSPEGEWGTFQFVYAAEFLLIFFVVFSALVLLSPLVGPRPPVRLPEAAYFYLDDADAWAERSRPPLFLRLIFFFPRYTRTILSNLIHIHRLDFTPREIDLAVTYLLSVNEPRLFQEVIQQGAGYSEKQRLTVMAVLARLEYLRLRQEDSRVFVSRANNAERLVEDVERSHRGRTT